MQISETVNEHLRREFRITVAKTDLDARLSSRLEGMKGQVNLKGFRPGKVPVAHLRKTYGKSMMGEILQETVAEFSQRAVEERSLRPAMSPSIKLESEVEKVLDGAEDLVFTMGVDLMPDFTLTDVTQISLARPVAEVDDEQVMESLKRLASQQRTYAYENGKLLHAVTVSTGLPGTPTVTGTYNIYVKYDAQLMTGPGYYLPNVPYVMYFYRGYGLHGTYWHNNFGHPMSHGCVNLPTDEARWFYDWAPVGTKVVVRWS